MCNGLMAIWHEVITWNNSELLSVTPTEQNLSKISLKDKMFSLKEMHFENVTYKTSDIFCLSA